MISNMYSLYIIQSLTTFDEINTSVIHLRSVIFIEAEGRGGYHTSQVLVKILVAFKVFTESVFPKTLSILAVIQRTKTFLLIPSGYYFHCLTF